MATLKKTTTSLPEKNKGTYRSNIVATNISLLLKEKYTSASNFPLLKEVYGNLLRNFSKTLQDFLDCDANIEFVSSESVEFKNVISSISIPCMVGVISTSHNDEFSNALIIIENQFVYTLLDILLGGGEYSFKLKVKDRSFTKIEDNVVKGFCNILLVAINESFNDVSSLKFRFQRLENGVNSILIADAEEFCSLLTLKITPQHKEAGYVKLLIPYSTMKPYKNELTRIALKSKDLSEREKWMQYFENTIQNIKLNISIEHSEKTHNLKSLANIRVGSTIVLNKLATENWDIVVNNAKISDGKLGQMNNRVAVEILDQIDASKYTD